MAVDELGFIGEIVQTNSNQSNLVGIGVPDGPFQKKSNFYLKMLDLVYMKPRKITFIVHCGPSRTPVPTKVSLSLK